MKTQVGDIEMFYALTPARERKEKGPLLLLHGNGGSHRSFDRVVKELSRTRDCYALDARAHGRTDSGTQTLTYPQLGQDVIRFIEKLGLGGADFLGYSDGGIIALEVAAHSSLANKVIAMGANWDTDGISAEFGDYARSVLRANERRRVFRCARRRAEHMRLMLEAKRYDCWEALSQITSSVMLMVGDRDVIDDEQTKKMASYIPTCRICVIENCGHSIMRTQREVFLKESMNFFEAT